ncbi:MAG: DNA methyltransferase, partial [Vulcanisaeta sp.]
MALGRYWGKKPPELIAQFLSKEDETVVDPFGGAGTIISEAIRLGKRVIYSEINPYAWLIAYVTIAGAPRDEFLEAAKNVLATAMEIEGRVRRRVLPRDWLRYDNGDWFLKRRNGYRVSDFFPRENIRRLAALLRGIDEVDASINTKLALYLAFSNALHLSSFMRRPGGGAWAIPSYWVGNVNEPLNAYEAFNRVVKKLRGSLHEPINVCHSIGCGDAVLLLDDALRLRYKPEWTL